MKKLTILTVATATILTLGTTIATHSKADEVKEGQTTFYVVESGDTLSKIAGKYGVDFTVVHANNADQISNADLIFPGQKLIVAGEGFDKTKTTVVSNEVTEEDETNYSTQESTSAQEAPAETTTDDETPAQSTNTVQEVDTSTNSAKEWIAYKESGGSYTATNGRYWGKYQLDSSYLGGDFSPENQERVADKYVAERYGNWENAKAYWLSHGWY